MVDVQTIGVLVTAASVSVAAIYYIMTLRVQQNNMKATLETRKLQFVMNAAQQLFIEEQWKTAGELMNMSWSSYDDFEKKYGSDFNLDNYAKRTAMNYTYNSLGYLLREKLVDAEVLYGFLGVAPCFIWHKFGGVLKEQRRRYMGVDHYEDFEFLANEMMRIKHQKDPSYSVPDTFLTYVPNNDSQ